MRATFKILLYPRIDKWNLSNAAFINSSPSLSSLQYFLICLLVSDLLAKWITWVLFGFTLTVFVVEQFFLPSYGVRGS